MKIIVNTVHEWIVQVSDNCLVVDVDPYESITDEQMMKEATDHGVKLTSLLDVAESKKMFVCGNCMTRTVAMTPKIVRVRALRVNEGRKWCAKCFGEALFEI